MRKRELQLKTLAEKAQGCSRCPLHRGRTHVVYGEGPAAASAMLVGEAPGRAEDEGGRPFIGRTGSFFRKMLASCDLPSEELYITSAVKCRPPGNRDPKKDELTACRSAWLEKQIELIDPPLILVLGKCAAVQMLDWRGSLKELRGGFHSRQGRWLQVTYHPTAAMRFPKIREDFRKDLQRFGRNLAHSQNSNR